MTNNFTLMKVKGKPLIPLPKNAVRAGYISMVYSRVPIDAPGHGIFFAHGDEIAAYPTLMTWGGAHSREIVEDYGNREFVWIGIIDDLDGTGKPIKRDCFEERL